LLQSGPDKAQVRPPFGQTRPSPAEWYVEQNPARGPVYRYLSSDGAGELAEEIYG